MLYMVLGGLYFGNVVDVVWLICVGGVDVFLGVEYVFGLKDLEMIKVFICVVCVI